MLLDVIFALTKLLSLNFEYVFDNISIISTIYRNKM